MDNMTRREILDLPVMVDMETARRALCIGRNKAYAMAKDDHFPIAFEKYGRNYRLRRSDILAYLGIEDEPATPRQSGPSE